MAIRLLLAEDHEIVRQGVKALIGQEVDMEVVAETGDGLEAIRLTLEHEPDVLIVDLSLPGLDGMEVIKRASDQVPATRIVVLSMHANEHFIVEALQRGAIGYILKDETAEDLVKAIRTVLAGRRYLSPSLPDAVIASYSKRTGRPIKDRYEALTSREREVLQLLAEGYTGPEIAEKLFISSRTVDTHRANLMGKLDLHSQTELVHYALERGLIMPRSRPRPDGDR